MGFYTFLLVPSLYSWPRKDASLFWAILWKSFRSPWTSGCASHLHPSPLQLSMALRPTKQQAVSHRWSSVAHQNIPSPERFWDLQHSTTFLAASWESHLTPQLVLILQSLTEAPVPLDSHLQACMSKLEVSFPWRPLLWLLARHNIVYPLGDKVGYVHAQSLSHVWLFATHGQ